MDRATRTEFEVDTGFANLWVGRQRVVVRIHEGVDFDSIKYRQLMDAIGDHSGFPIVVILDDVNSYSVKLDAFMEIKNDERICCLGIVAYRPITRTVHGMGQTVTGKCTQFFDTLKAACDWSMQRLDLM